MYYVFNNFDNHCFKKSNGFIGICMPGVTVGFVNKCLLKQIVQIFFM